MTQHLISASELATHLPSRTVIVLHCVLTCNVILQSVPGAVVFVVPTDTQSLLEEINRTKATIKKQRVICLSTEGVEEASRTWWYLVTAGYKAVSVLNGGFKAWLALGYPSTRIEHFLRASQSFKGYFVRRESSADIKETGKSETDLQFLSTLPGDELIDDLLTPEGLLKPVDELVLILKESSVNLGDDVQTLAFGERAGTLLLALKLVGLNRLALAEDGPDPSFGRLQKHVLSGGYCSLKNEPLTSYVEVSQDFMTPISFTEIDLYNGAHNFTVLKGPSDTPNLSTSKGGNCACVKCLLM